MDYLRGIGYAAIGIGVLVLELGAVVAVGERWGDVRALACLGAALVADGTACVAWTEWRQW